ncbi:MAG: hypothetical protein Q8Q52_01330 [Acidimicrobiia bacterium]|nr:hypothetical protein [Acidimicrobiia bacterium]
MAFTEIISGSVKKIKWAWTTDASGDVSETTSNAYSGEVILLTTVPGTGGDAPTDLYDLTVEDPDGIDVLAGIGGDRSDTNTEHVRSTSHGAAVGALTFTVENGGNAKSGTAIIWVR